MKKLRLFFCCKLAIISFLFPSCDSTSPKSPSLLLRKDSTRDDGRIKIVCFYRDSLLDSIYREYDENKVLVTEGFYKGGIKTGIWKELKSYSIDQNGGEWEYTTSIYKNGNLQLQVDSVVDSLANGNKWASSIETKQFLTDDKINMGLKEYSIKDHLTRKVVSIGNYDSTFMWSKDGRLQEEDVLNNQIHREVYLKEYYNSGKLKHLLLFDSITQGATEQFFDENGEMTRKVIYDKDQNVIEKDNSK